MSCNLSGVITYYLFRIKIVKAKSLLLACYVCRMREIVNACRVLVGKLVVQRFLED